MKGLRFPAALVLALWGGRAWSETLTVGGNAAQFPSVAAALAAAKPGDTLRVEAGAHAGGLTLDKRVALEGAGRPLLRGGGRGSVLTVLADGCAIRGFVIEHSGRDLPQRVSFSESLTAREVLAFYCRLRKIPLSRIDDLLGGHKFDFDGFADKPVGQFSGGMAQRLGLAVACLPDAPILVLDEPTVSLDPEGAIRFREYLAALKGEGKTIVFSSHMLADVEQLADRVAILVGGRLVALETVEALEDGLMRNCRMRVVLRNPDSRWAETARQAGADAAALQSEALIITSRAEDRLKILRALETAGAVIERFATQEPSLEDMYLRYIHGQKL